MKLFRKFRNHLFRGQNPWKATGWIVYAIVGLTALISLIWAIYSVVQGGFYLKMGFWGSIGFWILTIGGLNWGVKAISGKDLFLN